MDQQHGVRDEGVPTRSPRRMSDSEAEKIRALLRLPPLLFYGELEDKARERCGKVIAKARQGRKSRWMI